MKKTFRNIFFQLKFHLWYSSFEKKIISSKKKKSGKIFLFKKWFYYHHGLAFFETYKEIFHEGIYDFKPQSSKPLIIDCGANMGLSVLYFSKNHPDAKIIAFEPDEQIVPFLRKNICSQELGNVHLIQKAVWIEESVLDFYTDNGMGGRIGTKYQEQPPKRIRSVKLRDYLNQPVDMLKMDIEGAEYSVLNDCEDKLNNINHIFVEYHSFHDEEQHLEDILLLLKKNGFRYHLKKSFSRRRPFLDKGLVCEKYDMAINIFAYKTDNKI